MKMNRRKLSLAVTQALSVGFMVGAAVPQAFGQGAPAAAPTAESGQTFRIEVTGTRMKAPGLTSFSPVSSYTAEEVEFQMPASVEEFFKTLPSAQAAIGSNTNNGTGGGATIDLRGLGSNRNLVLIDGRRVTPFNLTGSVNTDVIPLALLQRVDVITGGASAVYGADAISGVSNFILKKDFRGFDLTTNYGSSSYGDGERARTDLTWGAGFDGGKGNVAISFGYTKTNAIVQGDRPWSLFARSSASGNPQGSGTAVPTREGGDIFGSSSNQIDPVTGRFVPTYSTFNFNPDNYFQTPLDRTQSVAVADYLINNHADVYGQFLFTRSQVSSQLASSGGFLNDYNLNLGNPYLPAPARQQICTALELSAADCANPNTQVLFSVGRRFVENGPRYNDFINNFYQWTAGSKGDLVGSWTYDAYFSEGRAQQNQTRRNWGSNSKLQQAMLATDTTTCLDPSNGCVPINLFGAAGSITPDQMNFVNLSAQLGQTITQRVGSVSAEGDLGSFKSPWSKLPITAAVGYDQRTVSASQTADAPSQIQGEVLGTGAPAPDYSGQYTLKELYAEMQLPIITDMPWVRRLNLEAGYRYTKFSTASSDTYDTWKFGGEWEPAEGYKFRAMKNKATRAPSVGELFAPQITSLSNADTDPCQLTNINSAQANTPGTLSNLCVRTGVPLASVGRVNSPSAGQINNLTGGNPNLGPEVSDTVTAGIVWQPTQWRGITVTADYWDIKISKAITQPSVTDVLNGCYSTALNPTLAFNNFCQLVGRNPNNGSFNGTAAKGVITQLSNLGYIKTNGIDFFADYNSLFRDLKMDPKWGRLDMNIAATFVTTYEFRLTPNAVLRDCLGYYSVACNIVQSNGGPIFKTKFNQRTTWNLGDFLMTYNWRYLSPVDVEPGSGTWFQPYTHINAYNYLDVALQWSLMKNLQVNLAVTNLFDRKPPVVGNTIGGTSDNSGNTFPQSYDVVGRFATLGVELKF